MVLRNVLVFLTMDCEPARTDLTLHASRMSPTGPPNYFVSERSIRGYTATAKEYGFPTTLFIHPEVAVGNKELLLELQKQGACLGLHLHPYKFGDGRYKEDLGAYSASEQRKMILEAADIWERALEQKPLFFRGGCWSANDNTFSVLQELGFRGGSLSIPGVVRPDRFVIWSGADPYPHRAHLSFRQQRGNSDFVEVPHSIDFQRPLSLPDVSSMGYRGGYEWLRVDRKYNNLVDFVRNILERFRSDSPRYCTITTNTHNDQDYSNPKDPSTVNLNLILDSVRSLCAEMNMQPIGSTLESICNLVLSGDE